MCIGVSSGGRLGGTEQDRTWTIKLPHFGAQAIVASRAVSVVVVQDWLCLTIY